MSAMPPQWKQQQERLDQLQQSVEHPPEPIDKGGGGGDDGGMEERVKRLETFAEKAAEKLSALERDVAIIKSNYSTKEDVRNLAVELHKALNVQTWKVLGAGAALTAVVYFVAKNVH